MSVNDDDYAAGFEQGYRLIKGKNAYLPFLPYQPHTPYNSTPFREGLKKGIAKAGKQLVDK